MRSALSLPVQFVMNASAVWPRFSCRVHLERRYSCRSQAGLSQDQSIRKTPKGKLMARDSLSALIALNRFGFGPRGGASGDFTNAASDPRGFVKAELSRPSGALLEVPGLQSTQALAQAVFEYQDQVKQAREQAAKSAPLSEAAPRSAAEAKPEAGTEAKPPQRRGPSLDAVAMDIAGQKGATKPDSAGADAAMAAGETMQPGAAMSPNETK